jgi:hypothetical protein
MINELSLLKLNPDGASTKQKINDILCNEWPLSTKSIYDKLRKQYSAEISYQAAHKTIKELEEAKVIVKKGKGYMLSIDYIQKLKKVLEDVEKKYLQNETIRVPENFQGTIEIEFSNITDLDVSTAELLLSRQLAKGSNNPSFICILEYGWWTLKFRFEHLNLLREMVNNNPGTRYIIKKKTPFGEWISQQYGRIGAVGAPVGTDVGIDEDIFVQGDCIIEVKFSEETKKFFEKYYQKWRNINGLLKEFGIKDEPKIQATMRITKNPVMADFLRKQLDKVFTKQEKIKTGGKQ